MERTWKPTAAGILCIIAGAIGMLSGIVVLLLIAVFYPFAPLIIAPIVAIVPIVGGIYALRRKNWGLALAGSICTLILGVLMVRMVPTGLTWVSWIGKGFYDFLTSWLVDVSIAFGIPGLLATIFVIMGKREFK